MQKLAHRHVGAVVIGNALDWYDFIVYAYLAPIIAGQFFPDGSEWTPILTTYAVFTLSFVVRPFGGMMVGHFADIVGRRTLMVWIISMMTLGTAMICFMPTYSSIGLAAPVLITVARMCQGIAVGGEFGVATSFLVEHAPKNARGLYGSWQIAGQGVAILIAGAIVTAIHQFLPPEEQAAWGWRVPFIFGLLVGPFAMYIRMKTSDTPEFLEDRAGRGDDHHPIGTMLRAFKWRVLQGALIVIGGSASFYVLFIFMPTYARRVLEMNALDAYLGPATSGIAVLIAAPIMGALSDRFGRRPMLLAGTALLFLVLYPAFIWLHAEPGLFRLVVIEFLFGVLVSIYAGPFNVALVELFPVHVRATAMSVGYNVGVIGGGASPLVVSALIAVTQDALVPVYYVMACLLLSFSASYFWRPYALAPNQSS